MSHQEKINHPSHYNQIPVIECIDVIKHFDFVTGSIIKYAWRAGLKSTESKLDDLKKCEWYVRQAIEDIEGKQINDIIYEDNRRLDEIESSFTEEEEEAIVTDLIKKSHPDSCTVDDNFLKAGYKSPLWYSIGDEHPLIVVYDNKYCIVIGEANGPEKCSKGILGCINPAHVEETHENPRHCHVYTEVSDACSRGTIGCTYDHSVTCDTSHSCNMTGSCRLGTVGCNKIHTRPYRTKCEYREEIENKISIRNVPPTCNILTPEAFSSCQLGTRGCITDHSQDTDPCDKKDMESVDRCLKGTRGCKKDHALSRRAGLELPVPVSS